MAAESPSPVSAEVSFQLGLLGNATASDLDWDLGANAVRDNWRAYNETELSAWMTTLCTMLRSSRTFEPQRIKCALSHLKTGVCLRMQPAGTANLVAELAASSGSSRDARSDVRGAAAAALADFNNATLNNVIVQDSFVAIRTAGAPEASKALIRWLDGAHRCASAELQDQVAAGVADTVAASELDTEIRKSAVETGLLTWRIACNRISHGGAAA